MSIRTLTLAKVKTSGEDRKGPNVGTVKIASMWVILPFILIMLMSAMVVPISNRLGQHPIMHYENMFVITPIGDWDYWMLTAEGKVVYFNVCKELGNEPPFDSGETFLELNARYMGSCFSFKNVHPAYIMKRYGKIVARDDITTSVGYVKMTHNAFNATNKTN